MKKILKIFFYTILILSIVFYSIFWIYKKYSYKPIYFDKFISELLNKEETNWDKVIEKDIRPIKWIIKKKELEKFDSIYLGFKNISNEKFYYVSWGLPNSRIRYKYIIYKNGKSDTLNFDGFGCSTGIYLEPVKKTETIGSKILNPLMFNPHTNYPLPLWNKNFPKLYKQIFGDSVKISFEQATESLYWSKYPSQMIKSYEITISTSKIIENWKNSNNKIDSIFINNRINSYYYKENGEIKVSKYYEKSEQ